MATLKTLEEEKTKLLGIADIDVEIVDYLALVNTFAGVETGISCAGHSEEECKGRKGATAIPYVQLFFKDTNKGAEFLKEIYKHGCHLFTSPCGVTVFSPQAIHESPLPEQRERFFTIIENTLRRISQE
ncbi:hypothetical protein ES703_95612 [subsurface metagenome]